MIRYLFFLLPILLICQWASAQDNEGLRLPVILIRSGGESGAGFLVGKEGETLYFLTAAHVIVDPQNIDVQFRTRQRVKAKIFMADGDLDLAVISLSRPSGYNLQYAYILAKALPSEGAKILNIGHQGGNDWDLNYLDVLKSQTYDHSSDNFSITEVGISPGSSGGPVLDQNNQLLGMVLEIEGIIVKCIAINFVQSILKNWYVPMNFLSEGDGSYLDPLIGEMIFVEKGSFLMGQEDPNVGGNRHTRDEQPIHLVNVPHYYLAKYEITQAQWKTLMGSNPSYNKNCHNCPVENISWDDAQEFIQKLNQKSSYTYRLPTEAEWEYAAGGGNLERTLYSGINQENQLYRYSNYFAKGKNYDKYEKTAPVGSFLPTELGFYDLSGNVTEWCHDWYHDSYSNAPNDGSAWVSPVGSGRIFRGGSWIEDSQNHRVAGRGKSRSSRRDIFIGFRLARTP